ncbi:MAG: hypothetical protein ACI9C4_000527 [Paraglaciecola sp.]
MIPTTNNSPLLRPGRNIITWSAVDLSGNLAITDTEQTIDVLPIVSLAGSLVVREGQTVSIPVKLNGDAAQYPVTVSYAISGTADEKDHDLVAGSLSIASGQQASIDVQIIEDALTDSDEDLIITLLSSDNAVLSKELTFTLRISEQALAPIVNLAITQDGISSNTIYADAGIVEITAQAGDGNSDALTFGWSNTVSAINPTIDGNRFSFDPSTLDPEINNYLIEVIVTDGALQTNASVAIHIEPTAPTLSAFNDNDNDGMSDIDEGLNDADGDGIPDYLDAISEQYLMPTEVILNSKTFQNLMETQKGLILKMGTLAKGTANAGTKISSQDIVDDNNSVIEDQGHGNIGGLFDFEIHGLTAVEPTAVLVIPLDQLISQDKAQYRRFANGMWTNFIINGENQIRSAQKINGFCPAPLSDIYQDGILKYSQCIALTITDGGPNDSDRITNGIIKDTGGVSVNTINNTPIIIFPKTELTGL